MAMTEDESERQAEDSSGGESPFYYCLKCNQDVHYEDTYFIDDIILHTNCNGEVV